MSTPVAALRRGYDRKFAASYNHHAAAPVARPQAARARMVARLLARISS